MTRYRVVQWATGNSVSAHFERCSTVKRSSSLGYMRFRPTRSAKTRHTGRDRAGGGPGHR